LQIWEFAALTTAFYKLTHAHANLKCPTAFSETPCCVKETGLDNIVFCYVIQESGMSMI